MIWAEHADRKQAVKTHGIVPYYVMLKEGAVKNFAYIFKFLPKTVVAKDMEVTVERMTKVIQHPRELTLDEIQRLATLFEYDFKKFLALIVKEV